MMKIQSEASLSEVHQTVDTTSTHRPAWRRVLAYFGPAYLVRVGYMGPGNWATGLQGGAKLGYKLIWVLVMSNLRALLLQTLSASLGIVRGRDLAQANRETYPKTINFFLYLLAEVAIAACDLAEVLGMAIGIQLLTGVPLLYAVLITRSEEHTSELQSHRDLHSFPTRRSSDLAEVAIAACDLAEVLGMAIGIQLLTGIPLLYAVLIT